MLQQEVLVWLFKRRIIYEAYHNMEEIEKVLKFLKEEEFNKRFLKFNDCRTWASTLLRENAIDVTDLETIQSKSNSEEANAHLHTKLVKDPSVRKLRILSKALKECKSHDNQLALASMIDQFLDGKLY